MKDSPFAEDLQRDWSLLSVRIAPAETVIVVRHISRQAPPDSGGRHGTDIITYPDIYLEHGQAEFRFAKCLYVRVWDEFALSTQKPDPEPSQFDGRTFRRYTKSSLLDLHSHLPTAGFPAAIHYQLNFPNEIIDILCQATPIITVRSDRIATDS